MNIESANLRRAQLLLQQRRFDAAEEHLHQALLEDPGDPLAHAWLAQCLLHRDDFQGATREARQAIGLAPDVPYFHYVLALVCNDRNTLDEAGTAIDEAIRLDPHNADFWGLRAILRLRTKQYDDALTAAEHGLAIDPDHVNCTNIRAQALVGLGRRDEAGQTIDAALRRDPSNAWTHANMGWTLLHARKPRDAMHAFREALRLDPDMAWARQGVVESMKARFFVYRIFLAYLLWMSRLSSRAQWGILIGGYIAYRIAGSVSSSQPALKPFLLPVIILYIAFAVLTILAYPLFNLLLCLSRFGRLALSTPDRIAAGALAVAIAAAAATLGLWLWLRTDPLLQTTIVLALFVIPVAITGTTPPARRRAMIIYTAVIGIIGAVSIALPVNAIAILYGLGAVGSIWAGNILSTLPERARA